MRRRRFLRGTAALAAGLPLGGLFGGLLSACDSRARSQSGFTPHARDAVDPAHFTTPLFIPGADGPFGVLAWGQAPLTLEAQAGQLPILDGRPSPFLWYRSVYGGRTYQNPTLVVQRGQRVRATLNNRLREPTIIHWHGLHLPGRMDGTPPIPSPPAAAMPTTSRSPIAADSIGITRTRTNSPPSRPMPDLPDSWSSKTTTSANCGKRST